jgi:phosphoenolpyruvate-protein phosphotransferase (PTS system enzyme I)
MRNNQILPGIAASPGIAIGQAYIHRDQDSFAIPRTPIQADAIQQEMVRLRSAQEKVRKDLLFIREKISEVLGENYAEIIDTHLAILDDQELQQQVEEYIRNHLTNVAVAFKVIINQYVQLLNDGESEYFRDRILDIKEVKQRVLRILLNRQDGNVELESDVPIILVARYLTPGDIITLGMGKVKGFVAEYGGPTSHVAILAKAFKIPTVLGVHNLIYSLQAGEKLIVDGNKGEIINRPDFETESLYRLEISKIRDYETILSSHNKERSATTDDHAIALAANLGLAFEVENAIEYGAEGVGLYRSEYIYLMKHREPSEEELYTEYRYVVEKMAGKNVVLRTFDLGGDKMTAILRKEQRREDNPFMGYRAIRISLDRSEMFLTQLRAMLRASAHGQISIMFPMITRIEEIQKAKEYVEIAKAQLRSANVAFQEAIPLGVLVEVPSAALLADRLAKEVNFFSIGTNDLTQYMLAVDRGNEKVKDLYCHYDPVMIRVLKWIIDAGNRANLPVSVCGEMAGEPLAISLLVGMGISGLSMAPIYLNEAREIIRHISFTESKALADEILKMSAREEIIQRLQGFIQDRLKKRKYPFRAFSSYQ